MDDKPRKRVAFLNFISPLVCYKRIMNKFNTFVCLTHESFVHTLIAFQLSVYLSKFQPISSINHDYKCFITFL